MNNHKLDRKQPSWQKNRFSPLTY